MLAKFFLFRERNTNFQTESLAGLTTFLTMGYIMFVNPAILSEAGMDKQALIAVTCIISALSTILMGIFGKVPIALAPGMGLNAFFAYTLVIGKGIPWQTALGMVFLAGVAFLLLSLTGAREKFIQSIPKSLVTAIAAGIGFFLLFIGFKNMGLVVAHPATLVQLASFSPESMIGIATLMFTVWLMIANIKGALLIGIVGATLASILLGYTPMPETWISPNVDISPIAFQMDLKDALQWTYIGPIFALFFVDMFDTIGTLVACSLEAKLEKKDGSIERIRPMLLVDAAATTASGLLGTSPTTAFVESTTGITAGGKTGFTSVVTGLLFLLGLVFIPVIGIVPAYATAPSLIIVGVLMISQMKSLPFGDMEEFFPAVITIGTMVFSFQIAAGISMGFLSWGIIKMLRGKFAEIPWIMYIVMALSALNLSI
ncbi:NCS2 family permease [Pontibacter sp. G13]|uniref:NCS2 family permease n=1 Tax=Pontibacter sp. G13 TaxID=3074898 RepID=UPI00288BAE6D|nr:NCS2 family permease [Pontibacter sp. G13]WNJ19544.1 NCS2 family permease [Pontibacter sp. G13]